MTRRAVLAAFMQEIDPIAPAWNRLVKKQNEFSERRRAGFVDVERMKELSKLWRELEASEGWPK